MESLVSSDLVFLFKATQSRQVQIIYRFYLTKLCTAATHNGNIYNENTKLYTDGCCVWDNASLHH